MELNSSHLFFKLPIYSPIILDEKGKMAFQNIANQSYQDRKDVFEGYNPIRKSESSFEIDAFYCEVRDPYMFFMKGGVAQIIIRCRRWGDRMQFFIRYDERNSTIIKVGQDPSIADFHIHEIKQYTKVLSKEKLKEFTRAIGLAANGVGIGSFVYLRRIFEGLIEEAHEVSKADQGWDEEQFSRARMADKIQLLESHLPPFLVENKSLYGILSTGIHGLTEEDCLAHFDTVRVGIELILDEKLEAFEKKRKVEEAKQKLAALTNKLKSGS